MQLRTGLDAGAVRASKQFAASWPHPCSFFFLFCVQLPSVSVLSCCGSTRIKMWELNFISCISSVCTDHTEAFFLLYFFFLAAPSLPLSLFFFSTLQLLPLSTLCRPSPLLCHPALSASLSSPYPPSSRRCPPAAGAPRGSVWLRDLNLRLSEPKSGGRLLKYLGHGFCTACHPRHLFRLIGPFFYDIARTIFFCLYITLMASSIFTQQFGFND